jgi:hypothetical protein
MALPALLIPAVLEAGIKVIERIFPDPEEAAKAKLELFRLEQTGELAKLQAEVDLGKAQADVNAIEAASDDKFKSRWRPAIGWVCVLGLAYQFLLRPIMIMILLVSEINVDYSVLDLDIATLTTIIFGMLGLGFYRTVEKTRGVA